MNKPWIPALSIVALTLGCSSQTDDSSRAAGPAAAPVTEAPSRPTTAPGSLSGKVAETMDSGGYTYVLIDTGSEEVWAATRMFFVAVGDEVVVGSALPMPGWHSDTLDRTFDTVYFAESIQVPGKAPEGHASPSAVPASLSGKVAETMDSGGYTYVQIDTGTETVWAAAPGFSVAVGDDVVVEAPMAMSNYHSSTLDRTFELVYFAGSIHPPGEVPTMHGGPKTQSPASVDLSGIEKVEGGVVVEEVFSKRQDLVGTEIAVRGKVVKYNAGILDKNWLHIRDGSGAEGTNDLTITTDAEVAVGDVVLIRGKLVADRDFGFGYEYALIVEDAKVTVE